MEARLMGLTILITVCLIATATITTYAQIARAANPRPVRPNAVGSNSTNAKLQKQPQACGSLDDLSKRIEICASPVMNLIQGTVEKWPRNESDAIELCESFAGAEKCIRSASRQCAKGLQKSILTALAGSIQRARKRECSRAQAAGIVKTTMCIENHQDAVHDWMNSVTGRLSAIELQEKSPEKRINAICCMVRDIDKELKATLDPFCPAEGAFLDRIYRMVIEDVDNLICSRLKCTNYMKGYVVTKAQNFDGIISIILRIVFTLDSA